MMHYKQVNRRNRISSAKTAKIIVNINVWKIPSTALRTRSTILCFGNQLQLNHDVVLGFISSIDV
jgi:hypothetical protein